MQNLCALRQTERNAPTADSQQLEIIGKRLAECNQRLQAKYAEMQKGLKSDEDQQRALKLELEQLTQQIAVLDEQLNDLEKKIINGAQVIATTLTKTYMSSMLQERFFDTIIIDEVSIAPLPTLYLTASHSTRSVIVIGDPCQLPPIATAETPAVNKWLKRDLFEITGVSLDSAAIGEDSSVLLREQFRMNPAISIIPRKYVYEGLVVDGRGIVKPEYDRLMPSPNHPLVLCDTSDVNPRASKPANGRSRYNEYHVACALNIAEQVLKTLQPLANKDDKVCIGIVTPYRAQAERIAKAIKVKRLDSYIRIGTIHGFQGLEFEAVILDTVDSIGVSVRREFTGEAGKSAAMRLINVAVTRAQHKLIIIANTNYLKAEQRQGRIDDKAILIAAIEEARKASTIMSLSLPGMAILQ